MERTIAVNGQTLCAATESSCLEILQLFLGCTTFPNHPEGKQFDSLASGVKFTHCNPDDYGENGDTALIVAARRGSVDMCRELIIHGASVNKPSQSTGESALAIAIDHHHLDVVRLLLRSGCDVQTCDNVKSTPLYAAVRTQDPVYVCELIEHGADPNIGSQDHTPVFLAARLGLLDIAMILEKAGCCLNSTTSRMVTPLHEACLKGHIKVVEYFISKGCDVNKVDDECRSPLLSAAGAGHLDVCRALVDAGANITVCNEDFENPLHLAVMNGHADVMEFFLQQGLEVSPPCKYRHSIKKMIQMNHHEAAAVLLSWCSDLDLTDCLDWPYLGIHSIIWNDRRLLRMLILSGIGGGEAVIRLMVPSNNNNSEVCLHETFLLQHRHEPLSLKELSRIVIRRRLGNRVVSRTESLPLPRYIKDYVTLKVL